MSGATASLPDLGAVRDAVTNAQSGLGQFLATAGALANGGPDSPLNAVTQALGGLHGTLDIDMSGIAERLPQAMTTIRNALPADALRFVEDLQGAYAALSDFLNHSPLVQQIGQGQSLEQTALAVIDGVLQAFGQRLAALGEGLIDADTLAAVRQALELLDRLAGGQAPAAGELVTTLAQQLVGVPHTLLDAARGHLGGALSLLDPFSPAALDGLVAAVRDALAAAFLALASAVQGFDAADAAAYPALEALLAAWHGALQTAFDALDAAFGSLIGVVQSPAWDSVFSGYAAVLGAVPLPEVPTVGDAIDAMAGLLESLISRLHMSLSPAELATQVTRVSGAVHELFAQSALSQVRQMLVDFIGRIQAEVEKIPTDEVKAAVTGMLQRVHQELDSLGIAQIRQGIADGFVAAHDAIAQQLGGDLLGGIHDALAAALAQFNTIPIADVAQALSDAIAQAGALVQQLAGELSQALDQLRDLLSQLDNVDFKPVADEVIDEIDALKAKLAAIKPESLSDAEKFALQGGLALLRAIDLEGMVNTQLKQGFATVDQQLAQGVQAVLDAWNGFRGRILGFDGDGLMAPVNALLDQVTSAVQGVNGALVTQPLDALVEQLLALAQGLSPAALLQPLQAPYQQMMAAIERANPDVWVQPLRGLHTEIDRVVDLIDITPLLDLLEQKERALFATARAGLLAALDALQLPPPLDSFLDTMKALVMGLADAVFADPDTALAQFNLTLGQQVRPSTLFQPLDLAFDRLLAAIAGLPPAEVLAALEAIRVGLGAALPAMNPGAVLTGMRQAQQRLAVLQPSALAGVLTLPALRLQLDARLDAGAGLSAAKASLRAQFDLALAPVVLDLPGSRLNQLQARQRQLADALRQRINGLDASGAQAAYSRLVNGLDRLLPAFLRQPQPLTRDDVTAGLAALRPSTQARRLDAAVERFLADLAPLQTALDGSVNGFFQEIRQAAQALHPGSLKDAVAGVYAALRARLGVLDPDALAGELRTAVWEPLIDPLRAIDPAAIGQQLDALYQQLIATLGGAVQGLVGQIRSAVDAFLAQVRAALKQVLDALKQQIELILGAVTDLLAQVDALIVHDLLERLLDLLANLERSFDQELDRVTHEFDEMLAAIPLGGSGAGGQQALAV